MGQMVKGAYFSVGFYVLLRKKKRKKRGVFTKVRCGARGTIFKLLGILPKIIDGTNGERCILFSKCLMYF